MFLFMEPVARGYNVTALKVLLGGGCLTTVVHAASVKVKGTTKT